MSRRKAIYSLAEKLGRLLLKHHWRCVVAESCTGGSLSAAITDIPGCSQWFDRGFVTYTNQAKQDMLSVPEDVIATHGAVSEPTVLAMTAGAIAHSNANISAAISGIAGPSGGSREKPVGTVWIAWSIQGRLTQACCYLFKGDRISIREQAVEAALDGLLKLCNENDNKEGQ